MPSPPNGIGFCFDGIDDEDGVISLGKLAFACDVTFAVGFCVTFAMGLFFGLFGFIRCSDETVTTGLLITTGCVAYVDEVGIILNDFGKSDGNGGGGFGLTGEGPVRSTTLEVNVNAGELEVLGRLQTGGVIDDVGVDELGFFGVIDIVGVIVSSPLPTVMTVDEPVFIKVAADELILLDTMFEELKFF